MPTTTTNTLSFSLRRHDDETIVTGTGPIDRFTTPHLREMLTDLIDTGHHRLILDLTDVSSCNSTGLAVMIHTLRQIMRRHADGHMFLVCDGPLLRTFQHTGTTTIFPVRTTLSDALSDAHATPGKTTDQTPRTPSRTTTT